MGRHGRATAQGQREMFLSIDITAESIGCEMRPIMHTDVISQTPKRGFEVNPDANAAAGDTIIKVNHIKVQNRIQ